jgi:hypothetical protein
MCLSLICHRFESAHFGNMNQFITFTLNLSSEHLSLQCLFDVFVLNLSTGIRDGTGKETTEIYRKSATM